MKILLLAPAAPPYGGMALQAAQLDQRLRQDGNSVDFFASNFPLPLNLPVVRTLLRLLLIWPKLWFRVGRVECVHVFACSWWYFLAAVTPAVVVGRLRRRRVVVNYRGGEAAAFLQRWGWFAGPVLRLAHQVTAPSQFLAGVLGPAVGVPVSIVPNLIDRERFVFRQRPRFAPRLVVTRHLEPIYGQETVLRAFRRVLARHPEATLEIAGGGSEAAKLRALVDEWKLTGVTFLGPVQQAALPAVYDRNDIYINASTVDNFPGALVEASSAGLVVVSTNAGGIPHLYEDGVSAALAPVGDDAALAAAVLRVVDSPEWGQRLVAGAQDLLGRSEWPSVRQELYRTYGVPAAPQMATRLL